MKKSEILSFPSNQDNLQTPLKTPIKPKQTRSVYKSCHMNTVSPISVNLFSNQIVKIGELSENAYSKFYESSVYMSPEQRISRYHRKLNSLSKIIEKKFPNMIKSRQLDKFLLYEHGLMQTFRVIGNGILRKIMISFKEIKFLTIIRNRKKSCLASLLTIYKKKRISVLTKFIKKWKNGGLQVDLFKLKYKKVFTILFMKNMENLKDAFVKIRVLAMKKKIKSLMESQFLLKEENFEEEAKLKKKTAFFTMFYAMDRKFQHQTLKFNQLAFYKIFFEANSSKIKIKTLINLMRILTRKGKKIAFNAIDDFSKRKRILLQIMNSFRVKTLIKSFWALRHWKEHKYQFDDEKNQLKCLFLIEKLRKIEQNCKKHVFQKILDFNRINRKNEMRLKEIDHYFLLLGSLLRMKQFKIMKESFDLLKSEMNEG